MDISKEIAEIRPRLSLILRDFSDDYKPQSGTIIEEGPKRSDFPVPDLVLFALRDVMGFHCSGHAEKVRWAVYCAFEGYPISFALRKFGFRFAYPKAMGTERASAVKTKLKKALRVVERCIKHLPEQAAASGDVALANRYNEFDRRYRFFRALADERYGLLNTPPPPTSEVFSGILGNFMENVSAGSFLSAAMVDAYYSRLEHLMILMLPFLRFDSSGGSLLQLIRGDWDEKFRAIFDIQSDKKAKGFYDRLKRLKERIRNPLAHGGFEKGWWSLHFTLPNVAVIPGSLSGITESVQFDLFPIQKREHQQIGALFDAMDRHLRSTAKRRRAFEYINAGLDVSYNSGAVIEYTTAMKNKESWAKYIDRRAWLSDMHANMDY